MNPTARRQPIGWTVALAVLAAAVLAAAALLPVLALRGTVGSTVTPGYESSARTAARDLAVAMMSIGYSTVDSDMDKVLALSTGDFRRQYRAGAGTVRHAIVANKVRSTARVLSIGTGTAGPKRVVVLIAIDAVVRNAKAPDGATSHYRASVTVVPVQGRWLVSKLSFVG